MREVLKPAALQMSCRGFIRPAIMYITEMCLIHRHCGVLHTVQAHQCTSSMGSAAECHDSTEAMTTDCLVKGFLAGIAIECLVGPNGSPNVAATLCLLCMKIRQLMAMRVWHEPGLDFEPLVRKS